MSYPAKTWLFWHGVMMFSEGKLKGNWVDLTRWGFQESTMLRVAVLYHCVTLLLCKE